MIPVYQQNVAVGGESIHTFRSNYKTSVDLRVARLTEALRYLPVGLTKQDIKVTWVSTRYNEFALISINNKVLLEVFPEDAELSGNKYYYVYVGKVLRHLRKVLTEVAPAK